MKFDKKHLVTHFDNEKLITYFGKENLIIGFGKFLLYSTCMGPVLLEEKKERWFMLGEPNKSN